jgi:hypothetical protein
MYTRLIRALPLVIVVAAIAGAAMPRASAVAPVAQDAVSQGRPDQSGGFWSLNRGVTVPAGTVLRVRLKSAVGSDISRVEDPVRAELADPIVLNDRIAIPAGSSVTGTIVDLRRPGRVEGRAHIAMRFDTLRIGDDAYGLRTEMVGRTARSTKKRDAVHIGISTGVGALVGSLFAGGKGAGVGSVVGGAAGTGYVLATPGKDIHLGPSSLLSLRLAQPLVVHARQAD